MAEQQIRLSDLKPGQTWLMRDVVRICRVVGPETIQVATRGAIQTLPAMRMKATLPHLPIEGFVSEMKAAESTRLLSALEVACSHTEGDDRQWEEIWAERAVPKVEHDARSPARIREDIQIPQLYVQEVVGKRGARQVDHMLSRGQVEGDLVSAELVPAGLFGDAVPEPAPPASAQDLPVRAQDVQVKAPDVQVAHTNPPDAAPTPHMTITRARKLAREKGIDVSGISGKGAIQKIVKLLETA